LVEVELHHVDLDAGYRYQDWSDAFADRLLDELVEQLPARLDGESVSVHRAGTPRPAGADRVVTGPLTALVAWLTGRSDGADLEVLPSGPVPTLPAWL